MKQVVITVNEAEAFAITAALREMTERDRDLPAGDNDWRQNRLINAIVATMKAQDAIEAANA